LAQLVMVLVVLVVLDFVQPSQAQECFMLAVVVVEVLLLVVLV